MFYNCSLYEEQFGWFCGRIAETVGRLLGAESGSYVYSANTQPHRRPQLISRGRNTVFRMKIVCLVSFRFLLINKIYFLYVCWSQQLLVKSIQIVLGLLRAELKTASLCLEF